MKYSIRANEIKGNEKQQGESASHLRGFATLIIGDHFKISNIAILESNEGKLFVSMPRYKSSDKDEKGANVYKDVCNPTKRIPNQHYLLEEKALLLPLPKSRYRMKKMQNRKISPDSFVSINSNKYSVPVKYVGKTVQFRLIYGFRIELYDSKERYIMSL